MDASHCISMENTVNATIGGVRMLIGQSTLKTLNSIERIQPRIMAIAEQQPSPAIALPKLEKKLN